MNIEKKTLEKVDVLYDDKKWGKRIDPDEWNANFKTLENAHNKLVDSLTEQVNIVDEAFSNATTEGGDNIHVDYSGGDFTLQQALDHVVNDINNRYTKLQSDTLLAENTNVLIRDISYNSQTGTFTITKKDGSVITIDTVIEKIPASMVLKEESDGSVWLVVTNQDGSQTKTNVTSLIEDTVISGTDTIGTIRTSDSINKITTYALYVKPNSIGLSHVDSELTVKFEETQSAKTLAVQAKDLAVQAKDAAVTAKNSAETYASNANTYSVNSNKSATESANSALLAKDYAKQAEISMNTCELASSLANGAKIAAEKARDEAQAAATDASKSKTAAEQFSSSASKSASSASQSAENASNSAISALQSKEAAALSEANSLANKNSSANSASAAATSETNAASSALAAQTAQTAAEKARDEAQSIVGGDYATKSELNTHVNNSDIHVTAEEKAAWNGKSNFSGSYNDLSDKPTIPTVPTKVSAFTNDAGYLTHHQDISGKANTSDLTAHTGNSGIHVTTAEKAAWNKSDVFVAQYNTTTNAEIEAAHQAGKTILLDVDGSNLIYGYFVSRNSNGTLHMFCSLTDGDYFAVYACKNDTWGYKLLPVLPKVSSTDAGKVLMVNDSGSWVATAITNAEGVLY